MPQSILFIDEVGAEYAKARITRWRVQATGLRRFKPFRPLAIRPIDVQRETGAAKRAAAGYLLLGAGGAAACVLMAKGQNVLFELECHDGVVRRGIVPQKHYPAMRRAVQRIVSYRPGDTCRQLARCGGFLALAIGLAVAWGGGGFFLGVLVGIGAEIALDRRRLAQPA